MQHKPLVWQVLSMVVSRLICSLRVSSRIASTSSSVRSRLQPFLSWLHPGAIGAVQRFYTIACPLSSQAFRTALSPVRVRISENRAAVSQPASIAGQASSARGVLLGVEEVPLPVGLAFASAGPLLGFVAIEVQVGRGGASWAWAGGFLDKLLAKKIF